MHVRILVYWLGISEVKGFCYSPSIGKTSLLTINMWSTITKAAYTKTKHTNWKGLLPRCKKNLDTGWHHHDIESVKSNGRHLQNTIRSLKTWSHRNSKIFLTVILLILPLYQLTPIRNSFLTHIIFFLTGAGFCFFFTVDFFSSRDPCLTKLMMVPLYALFFSFFYKRIKWFDGKLSTGQRVSVEKHLPSMRSKAVKLAIRSCQTQRIPYYGSLARPILHRRNSPPFVTSATYTRGLDRA